MQSPRESVVWAALDPKTSGWIIARTRKEAVRLSYLMGSNTIEALTAEVTQ